MTALVPRERDAQVDLAADRVGYLVVSYGLLLIVAYRSFVNGEAAWDLIGLVILGGVVGAEERIRRGVMSGRWMLMLLITMGSALIVASLIALATR